jgi:hypothetical protein
MNTSVNTYKITIENFPTCQILSKEKLTPKEIARSIAGLFCIKSILMLDYYILIDTVTDSITNPNRKLTSGTYRLIYR